MPSFVAGFDQLSHVAYKDTANLFYGKYPYKVLLKHKLRQSPTTRCRIEEAVAKLEFQKAKKKFWYRRQRTLPEDRSTWKHTDNGITFSVFFLNEADALSFIASNKRHVAEAHRPHTAAMVETFKTVKTSVVQPVVRDDLFWGQYLWRIEFQRDLTKEQLHDLDTWVTETYLLRRNGTRRSARQLRAGYHYSQSRCLYLHSETDVVYVRLGMSEYISKIQKALLKHEIV